jgi:hypothetical protein
MSAPVGPGYPYPPNLPPAPPTEPAPPRQGPGVVVPFAAPPTDRDKKRMWISLSIAGGLALLCLIGGIVGVVALVASSQVSAKDATNRVSSYLDALKRHDYQAAYDDLCTDQRDKHTEKEFARSQADQVDISSFEVGTPKQVSNGYSVPASIELVDGSLVQATFGLVLDGPGELRVCSVTG